MPKEAYNADDKPKPFAAFGVWHYEDEMYKIWQCSTRSILLELANLNEVEGDPLSYDLKITRKGAGLDTKYYVKASKPSELTDEALFASQEFASQVDLECLFTGDNPFK
jgi:alpha-acetolactate decarboxylase